MSRSKEFIFGSMKKCTVCGTQSCVMQHKDNEKLTKWYKDKKDPCWDLCGTLVKKIDIIGRKLCAKRCRAAIGLKEVHRNKDKELKVKMRVWIQPDERMYSSISPSEDITGGKEYATRCDVCGTHCEEEKKREEEEDVDPGESSFASYDRIM